ncbi:MAG: alpha/beta fold hydrolase [Planctomycetia bacterium]|nr:alpha/beta fold hydrolase [Planctomycetia bacterium]
MPQLTANRIPLTIGLALSCVLLFSAQAHSRDADPKHSWDIESLSRAPKFTWVDEQGPVRGLYFDGPAYRGKPTRVFAYYASPATIAPKDAPAPAAGTKYPGVVLVHGGGGHAFAEWAQLWAKRGYAAIAMDLVGCGLKGKRLDDGGPNNADDTTFNNVNQPSGDQWPYQAVADVVLAHSLLRSFPEVDADKTAVTGISWGGYLTCIVAGVDPRFKAAVPVYGCGFLHDNSYWGPRMLKALKPEDRAKWVRLWDPSSHVGCAKMPMFFVNGTNDFAYPLDSYAKTYKLVRSPLNYRVTVNMPHGHSQGWAPAEIGLFVDQHLRGGDPLPVIAKPAVADQKVSANVTSSRELKLAALHYTTDQGEFHKRRWTSKPLTLDGKRISGPVAPAEAAVWFVTVTDDRGAIVSSELMFNEK